MPKQATERAIDTPFSKRSSGSGTIVSASGTATSIPVHGLEGIYHTGNLDSRYYTETELNAGQLNGLYYTETELNAGQLDTRYYTETESDARFLPLKGSAQYQIPVTGSTPFTATYTALSSFAGSGLAFSAGFNIGQSDGIVVNANDIAVRRYADSGLAFGLDGGLTLGTPIAVSISTTSVVTGVQHGHAVISSSNPGAAASLLATSAGGTLTLNNGGSTTTPALVIGNGSTGRIAIGSSGWRDNATQLEMLGSRTLYVGSNPVGGVAWSIDTDGQVSASAGDGTIAHVFGLGTIGPMGVYTNYFGVAATPFATTTDYALMQSATNGNTFLNAPSGQGIYHRIANTTVMQMESTGLLVGDGKLVGSLGYVSGWAGSGWRADQNISVSGQSFAEFDNLSIRGTLSVYELVINQIRATNGTLIVSSAGKIDSVSGSNWTFEDPNASNLCAFAVNDLVIIQSVDVNASTLVKRIVRRVSAVSGKTITVTAATGGPTDTGTAVAGDTVVRFGNTSNAARQGVVLITSDMSNSPYQDVISGVTSWADWTGGTKTRVRMGHLSGITGTANEYGIIAGTGYTSSDSYAKFSTAGVVQNNVNSTWRSGGTTFLEIDSSSGVDITIPDDAPMYSRGYSFKNSGGTNISSLWAWYSTVDSSNRLELFAGYAARKNMIDVIASSDSTHDADILLRAAGRGQQADMFMLTSTSGSSVNFSGITSSFSVDAPQVQFSDATTFLINDSVTADTYLRFSSFTDTYIKSTYNATGTLRYIDISAGATSRVRLGNGNGFSLEADTNTVDVNGKLYSSGIVEVGQGRTSGNISRFTGRNTTVSSISLTATTGFYGAAIGFNAHHANDSVPPTASGAFKFLGTQYTGNVTRPGMQFWDGHNGIMSWYCGEAGLASSADVTTWTKTFEISTTLVNSQLPITVSGGTELIKLNGSGTSGNASTGYIAFYDSNTTTRRGFIGDATSANTDIYLRADTSALHLGDSTSIDVIVLSSGGTKILGNIGFYNTTPIAKQTVTGSRGGNAALASLLTALASHGLITNSSTA